MPADTQTRAAPPRRVRRLRRLWRPAAALAAVIGIGVTASWWFTEGRYIESTDNAYVQGDIAVLGPRIEGDVAAIKVADNQRVHAGDPLIVLDPADWQARLAQATASAAEATAAVETAQRQVAQQQATIDAAQAAIAQAQAEQTRASADADALRLAGLGRLGVAPVQRPGDRRCTQGQCRRGLGAGAEGSRRAAACRVPGPGDPGEGAPAECRRRACSLPRTTWPTR